MQYSFVEYEIRWSVSIAFICNLEFPFNIILSSKCQNTTIPQFFRMLGYICRLAPIDKWSFCSKSRKRKPWMIRTLPFLLHVKCMNCFSSHWRLFHETFNILLNPHKYVIWKCLVKKECIPVSCWVRSLRENLE